jgi:hypothetical protein
MELFTVGDLVKAVNIDPLPENDVAPPLELDKNYEVKEIVLDRDGNQHLDVGLVSGYSYIRSYETKEDLPRGSKIHWCHPSRFVKCG